MKLLILSDIHGNWAALQSVLDSEADFDKILCLGDLVDYGRNRRRASPRIHKGIEDRQASRCRRGALCPSFGECGMKFETI
jgi:predicted phosphodiesterase